MVVGRDDRQSTLTHEESRTHNLRMRLSSARLRRCDCGFLFDTSVRINFIVIDSAKAGIIVRVERERSLSKARNCGRRRHVELLVDFRTQILIQKHFQFLVLSTEFRCLIDGRAALLEDCIVLDHSRL